MGWIKILFVGLLLGRAIYTDVKKGIVENKWMVVSFIMGLTFACMDSGTKGLLHSIGMALILLAILLFLFLLKGLGGGDIKLLAVLATFYPDGIWLLVIASFVAGAMMGIIRMVIRLFRGVQAYVKGETIHFSIAIALGTFYMLAVGG